MQDNSYWDYVSVNKNEDYNKEGVKDLVKDAFLTLVPYLNQLYWVDATVFYMNAYLDIPQVKIAEILGLSQFGVSKRYRSSIKKLKSVFNKPFRDIKVLIDRLGMLLPEDSVEKIILYYSFTTFSLSAKMSGDVSSSSVVLKINRIIDTLVEYAEAGTKEQFLSLVKKYKPNITDEELKNLNWKVYYTTVVKLLKYIDVLKSTHSYGSYIFKINDKKRSEGFNIYEDFGLV